MKELFNNLKFAWKYAKGERFRLIIFIMCNICHIVISIIAPIYSAKIIVSLSLNEYTKIITLAIVLVLIRIFSEVVYYVLRLTSNIMYRNILSLVETDLANNILKLNNESLDKNGSGVFIQRMTSDTSNVSDAFNAILGNFSTILNNVGIIVVIFVMNKLVFVYVVVMICIIYVISKIGAEKKNIQDKVGRKAKEQVSSFVGELVRGARDIKMLNSEKDFVNELSSKIKYSNNESIKTRMISRKYDLYVRGLSNIFSFILIVLLVFLLKEKALIPATALVLYDYFERVQYFNYSVEYLMDYIKDFNLSSERIKSIMGDKEFKKESFGNKHLDKVNGDFAFNKVTFGYDEKKVLKNLSFKVAANTTVAFVGKSGAGKTTIFNLLCKMYDNYSGLITIDDIDIQDLDKDSIRGNITVISQNPYIFNMSIKDNLKLVKADLTDKEMKEACKIACLEDFIKELPNGYDTIVGEGGITLSGGQRQRLAIARALVQKTEIILFDEATSALDNETQEKIQKAIENMKRDYTILIIAHRLSTVIGADEIMFLDNGKIEARGTHEELLKKCKKYKELYETELLKNK